MRIPPRVVFTVTTLLLAASCVVPENAVPNTTIGVDLASKYVHRGMVQSENGVLQTTGIIALPAKQDGTIIARVWANQDLSNDTGDAWMPDGHAGKFSQIDFNLLYEQRFDSATVTAGFVSYNLPNGLEFPFGERGATSEFLVEGRYQLSKSFLSLIPLLAIHYDYDEVEGFYIEAGLGHEYRFNEKALLRTDFGLAWMDGDQAWWNYGQADRSSGLADLTLRGAFEYTLQANTIASVFAAYSRVMDSAYRDWFDFIEIDPDQFYVGLGIRWEY